MRQKAGGLCVSAQCNFVRGQQAREMLAPEKGVFMFALDRQRVEADQGFVNESRMTHDEAMFRQPVEKLPHQHAEIGLPREIIGAGESGIEGDIGARGPAAKLRAQNVEKQRLRRTEPPGPASFTAVRNASRTTGNSCAC